MFKMLLEEVELQSELPNFSHKQVPKDEESFLFAEFILVIVPEIVNGGHNSAHKGRSDWPF